MAMRRAWPLMMIASAVVLGGARASAQETLVVELDAAEKALADADATLASGTNDCSTMCKALASMARATERICELVQNGTDAEKKRCTDAKAKLEEATKRVRALCPACATSPSPAPPLDASKKPETPPPPAASPTKQESLAGKAAEDDDEEVEVRVVRKPRPRTITIGISPFALFLPPWFVRATAEVGIGNRFAVEAHGGYGKIQTIFENPGRTAAFSFGLQARGYILGSFSRGGFFLGVDGTFAKVEGKHALNTRSITPGVVIGPVIGSKYILPVGFTIGAHLGAGFVVSDDRPMIDGLDRPKVVLVADTSIGWTF